MEELVYSVSKAQITQVLLYLTFLLQVRVSLKNLLVTEAILTTTVPRMILYYLSTQWSHARKDA